VRVMKGWLLSARTAALGGALMNGKLRTLPWVGSAADTTNLQSAKSGRLL